VIAAKERTSESGVLVVEPELPRRVRRPVDLLRLISTVIVLAATLTIADLAVGTAAGLEQDLVGATTGLPRLLLNLFTLVAALGVLALPVAVAADLLYRRRVRQLVDALVAAGLGAVTTLLLKTLIANVEPAGLLQALTKTLPDGGRSAPIDGLLVSTAAFLTVADIGGRRWLSTLSWTFIGSVVLTGFLSGDITAIALAASLLIGRSIGLALRYATGAASTRPPGTEVADALFGCGVEPSRLQLMPSEATPDRHYTGEWQGAPLLVHVFDRDTYGTALGRRVLRRLRLRAFATRGPALTVRGALEHETLMALALDKLGVLTPEPLAAAEVGPYAALVAFRMPTGTHTLTEVAALPEPPSDHQLRSLWELLSTLQQAKVAHRGLTAGRLLLTDDGAAGVLDGAVGEIAAADLALRLDMAQLLVTVALVVGPDRAVTSACETLGAAQVLRALPLLQRIALSGSTRRALREHKRLLHELRDQVLALVPGGEPVEEVELRRVRPRTLITVVGGAIAAYVLLTQLARVDFKLVLSNTDWRWAILVVLFTAMTFVGAALVITGAVLTKLNFFRTYLTQLAVSFTGLVAPSAIGNIAMNARYLERSGTEPAVAAASVGLAQIAQFTSYTILLAVSGVLAGTGFHASFTPSPALVVGFLAVLAVIVVVALLPFGRKLVQDRALPVLKQVGPRLVSVFQHPRKLFTLLGGALLLDLSFVAAFTCSTRAFGGTLAIPALAVVYFAGAIVGSAVPTPGGLGGVEAALAAGLTAAGMDGGLAVSAVLLFRMATFWLPIPFGWASINYLQRKGAL